MRTRRALYTAAGAVILLAAVFFAVSRLQSPSSQTLLTQGPSGAPQATPVHHYGAEFGAVDATLISPDNVTLHIVEIQRSTTKWLFHIHTHNNTSQSVSILDAGTNHYFMLAGRGLPGTPYTDSQMFLRLGSVGQTDLATHPALATTIEAGADSDGWLTADLTNFHLPPYELLYVYGTVTAPACANPSDQSTCHPSTGYSTLNWTL